MDLKDAEMEFADLLKVASRSLASIASSGPKVLIGHLQELERIAARLKEIGETIALKVP